MVTFKLLRSLLLTFRLILKLLLLSNTNRDLHGMTIFGEKQMYTPSQLKLIVERCYIASVSVHRSNPPTKFRVKQQVLSKVCATVLFYAKPSKSSRWCNSSYNSVYCTINELDHAILWEYLNNKQIMFSLLLNIFIEVQCSIATKFLKTRRSIERNL